jgi:hypothetical protein
MAAMWRQGSHVSPISPLSLLSSLFPRDDVRPVCKWLAISPFSRDDVGPVRNYELKILFAMINKIKVAPVKQMITQWLDNFKLSPVECTSLITRIAQRVGALQGNMPLYLPSDRMCLDEAFFIHGHILKHAQDGSLVFFFPGYANEIPLPNPGLDLYKSRVLTFPLLAREDARRSSMSDRDTRSRSRT